MINLLQYEIMVHFWSSIGNFIQYIPGQVSHSPGHFVWTVSEQQSLALSIFTHHPSKSSHFFLVSRMARKQQYHIRKMVLYIMVILSLGVFFMRSSTCTCSVASLVFSSLTPLLHAYVTTNTLAVTGMPGIQDCIAIFIMLWLSWSIPGAITSLMPTAWI